MCKQNSSQSDGFFRNYMQTKQFQIRLILEKAYANKTVPNQNASWEATKTVPNQIASWEIINKQNSSQSDFFLRNHSKTKQFPIRLLLQKAYANKTVPNQTASSESICKQRFIVLVRGGGCKCHYKQQAIVGQTAKLHLNDGPTLNAGLVALWIFRESGPVLLRNPSFCDFFRGERGGPDPYAPSLDPQMHIQNKSLPLMIFFILFFCLGEGGRR